MDAKVWIVTNRGRNREIIKHGLKEFEKYW